MTKKLVLVRHAKTERGYGKLDIYRELTDAGRAAIEEAYPRTFALLEGESPVIWASPAVRARQTAQVVASALGIAQSEIELHSCIYSQDEDFLLAELDAAEDECIVVVGHVPLVEDMAYDLAGIALDFNTGAACALELTGQVSKPAKLIWFVRGPKLEA